jgi:hypothetical protein
LQQGVFDPIVCKYLLAEHQLGTHLNEVPYHVTLDGLKSLAYNRKNDARAESEGEHEKI